MVVSTMHYKLMLNQCSQIHREIKMHVWHSQIMSLQLQMYIYPFTQMQSYSTDCNIQAIQPQNLTFLSIH